MINYLKPFASSFTNNYNIIIFCLLLLFFFIISLLDTESCHFLTFTTDFLRVRYTTHFYQEKCIELCCAYMHCDACTIDCIRWIFICFNFFLGFFWIFILHLISFWHKTVKMLFVDSSLTIQFLLSTRTNTCTTTIPVFRTPVYDFFWRGKEKS